jgi:hypothetical protein
MAPTTGAGGPPGRRSRPVIPSSQPSTSSTASSTPPATASEPGVAEKARARLQRSSRIGRGAGTTPVGNPTTTVRPSYGPSPVVAKDAVRPSTPLDAHNRMEPTGPT